MNLEIDQYCFACGRENPIGLKLRFELSTEGVTAYFTPSREHQGFAGILHGGIISTLLDEAMAHAVIAGGRLAVTARMELAFKKPTLTGEEITLKGRVIREDKKIIKTSAEIEQKGVITASATAVFIVLPEKNQRFK